MNSRSGFTLIEILLAITLFAIAVVSLTQSGSNSRRNLAVSRNLYQATLLAQSKMAEVEQKTQTNMDKAGISSVLTTETGGFEAPYTDFRWKSEVRESKLDIGPEQLKKFMLSLGADEDGLEEQMQQTALLLTNVKKMIKENFVELVLTINWKEFGRDRNLTLVTHLIPQKPKIELTTTVEN